MTTKAKKDVAVGADVDPLSDVREKIRRIRPPVDDTEPELKPTPVSAGPVDKIVEMVFNPSREKMPEMTVIDRIQGRLLPQLGIIDMTWQNVIETAIFRQDNEEYEKLFKKKRPISPNLLSEFTYLTAQWQKSVQGTNLKSAIDLALAETETRSGNEGDISGDDAWKD